VKGRKKVVKVVIDKTCNVQHAYGKKISKISEYFFNKNFKYFNMF
jgi:hypothetical protein